jgi:hypothetical protein
VQPPDPHRRRVVGERSCWHLPAAHDAAMRVPALRAAEYALFLGTAWWFWWQDHRNVLSCWGGGV